MHNSSSSIVVRRASRQDSDLIAALFNDYRQFYQQPADLEGSSKFVNERLDNNDSIFFLAFIENIPAGFVQLYPLLSSISMKKVWVLNDMLVIPEMRKNGVGAALLDNVKEWAKQTNAKSVVLETAPDNHAAQRLYEAKGYIRDNEYLHYALMI